MFFLNIFHGKIPKRLAFYFAFLAPVLFVPLTSNAAMLYLEPQSTMLGTQGSFSVVVLLDAEAPINTVSASIIFPKALEPYDVEIGESIVNLWVDKPTWNETTRTLTFSGVIPGGFQGDGGPLVTIDCNVANPNVSTSLLFDPANTHVYLSDGKGTQDSLTLDGLTLPVALGKENISPAIPDTAPPEAFTPVVSRSENIFNDQWFLSFSTEDKGGGVAFYEVKEQRAGIFRLFPSAWQKVDSPYILSDQALRSEIDVEAVDKVGNIRLETIPPRFPLPWYESLSFWIILVIVFVLYAAIRYKKNGKIF